MKRRFYRILALCVLAILFVGCGKNGVQNGTETEKNTQIESDTSTEDVEETESESEIPEPVVMKVTITATGDCALGALQYHGYDASFHSYYDAYGAGYFFKNFKEVFESDDLTIANLECVFTTATDRVDKEFSIKGKPGYTDILTSSSVEAVTMGNNHTQDYGTEGLLETQKVLADANVLYALNDTIAYYTTEDGIVIAVVSASVTGQGNSRDKYLLNGVEVAKNNGADLVVACPHWGIERENYPNDYQRNLAHALIDKGADLVIGNHAHTMQSAEEYKGKIIMYSLANFSFGANRNPDDKDTIVYQQTFTFVDGVLQPEISAKIIPSRISGYSTYNNFQPIIANNEQASVIIDRMNTYSKPYSGVFFDEQGNLLIETAK